MRIPLTLRGVARGVTLVTAHTQDDSRLNWQALAQSGTTLVIYMGVAKLARSANSCWPAEWRRIRQWR
jgi:uroporphyrin-III C-methyltransferase